MRRIAFVTLAISLLGASSALAQEPAAPPSAEPAVAPPPAEPPKVADVPRPAEVPARSGEVFSLRPHASIDPPEGSAGPATAAGTTGLTVQPGLEIFAAYDLKITPGAAGTQWFHDFEIPRAHASLSGGWGPVTGRVVLEAVRSASEGALLGVAGDSFVMRLREASAGYHYGGWLAVDAGVVPTLTIPELDGTFNLRAIGAAPLEATGLGSPADLGATVRVTFPQGYGFAAVGAYNGEGYTNRELNRGKNLEAAVELHPAPGTAFRPFAVFASYVNGSSGTGSARADRLTAALLWQGKRVRAGADFVYAWGVGENGTQRSYFVDGFVRVEPVDRLILGARAFNWERDASLTHDRVTELTGTVGFRIADPLEAFVAVTRSLPEQAAATALPGIDDWEVQIIGRVVF